MSTPLAFPKPARLVDPTYLGWISGQRCLLDGRPAVDPHHAKPKSVGGSDYRTLPLCREHHRECHRIGRETFQKRHNLDFAEEIIRHLERYLAGQREGD